MTATIVSLMSRNSPSSSPNGQMRGITLAELCIGLALASLLLTLSVPTFHGLLTRSALNVETQHFKQALQIARETSITQLQAITVCPFSTGFHCGDNWSDGWQVITPENKVLVKHRLSNRLFISSNRSQLITRPLSRSTNGTILFCDKQRITQGKAVVVSYSGKSRHTNEAGASLACN